MKCLFTLMLIVVMSISSCKKEGTQAPDNQHDPSTLQTEKLTAGTWQTQSVKIDNVDHTGLFTGFAITFTESGYTTENGGVIFPASGTWKFKDDQATTVVLDDSLELNIMSLDDKQFVFSLEWDQTTYERMTSLEGEHVFTMNL